MKSTDVSRYCSHIFLSVGVSGIIIALLIYGSASSAGPALWSSLVATITGVSILSVVLYCGTALVRSVLLTYRYGLLLRASEPHPPVFFHLFLVTLSRNMFVDMLPARLGELSYIAMLNRGFAVSGASCLSSLAISFVCDLLALGIMIAGIIIYQLLTIGLQVWIVAALGILIVIIGMLLIFLFPVLEYSTAYFSRTSWGNKEIISRIISLLRKTAAALRQAREAGILGRLFLLSLGIRFGKYLGLYFLFSGIVLAHFTEVSTDPASVLIALISAEAGAALPVPTFMSFGTYEATGILAMTALGANPSSSMVIMFSLHILSQLVDYTLGGIALIAFLLRTGSLYISQESSLALFRKRYLLGSLLLFCCGIGFLSLQLRGLQKRGSLVAPDQGEAAAVDAQADLQKNSLDGLKGFIVWSSNRYGNHDLLKLTLPAKELVRLTTHPHAEYYPRISPEGERVVFARSRQPWVSQRDYYAWDVYLLDLKHGTEALLAEHGNVPTWSRDGGKVYFQRDGNQVVELDLASGRETMLFQTGTNVRLPPSVTLETPMLSQDGKRLAVTLRGSRRETAIIDARGEVKDIGAGCQLTWGPSDEYLVAVDHGGKQQNAFYKIEPREFKRTLWFDAPGEFSHEYFPMVSRDGRILVYGASKGGHEHDTADYEIFLWQTGSPWSDTVRLTYHTGNDCWPDIFLRK